MDKLDFHIVLPTPQTEVLSIFETERIYTRIIGEDIFLNQRFVETESIKPSALIPTFICGKIISGREVSYNPSKIRFVEKGFKRVIYVSQTNNCNFAPFCVQEFFIPKGSGWYVSKTERTRTSKIPKDYDGARYFDSLDEIREVYGEII